jgi:hypothetical protein
VGAGEARCAGAADAAENEALVDGAVTLFVLCAVFYVPLDLATSYAFVTGVGGQFELNPFFSEPLAECSTRLCVLGVLSVMFLVKLALMGWLGLILLVYRFERPKELGYSRLLLRISLVAALLAVQLVANNALFLWLFFWGASASFAQVALFLVFGVLATALLLGLALDREPALVARVVDLPVLLGLTLALSAALYRASRIPYVAVSFALLGYGIAEVLRYYWEGGER